MKGVEKEVTIIGPILKAKAAELFPQLYPGPNETVPQFSNGWLDGWKNPMEYKNASPMAKQKVHQFQRQRKRCNRFGLN